MQKRSTQRPPRQKQRANVLNPKVRPNAFTGPSDPRLPVHHLETLHLAHGREERNPGDLDQGCFKSIHSTSPPVEEADPLPHAFRQYQWLKLAGLTSSFLALTPFYHSK